MKTADIHASQTGHPPIRQPFRAESRHLSSLGFPILYQVLFSYVVVIADLVTPQLGVAAFILFAIVGIIASSVASLWFMRCRPFSFGYFRVALPMLLALLLPLLQIGLLSLIR